MKNLSFVTLKLANPNHERIFYWSMIKTKSHEAIKIMCKLDLSLVCYRKNTNKIVIIRSVLKRDIVTKDASL